jgi:hypothetical protein
MRHTRILVVIFSLVSLLISTATFAPRAVAAPTVAQEGELFAYFPETGHNISFEIKDFFDAKGGVEVFGLPVTEVISDSLTGETLNVQYFQRARFEIRPDRPKGERITLTRLGSFLTHGRREAAFQRVTHSPDPNRDFYPETGHTLGGVFRDVWSQYESLTVFGYPISEEFQEYNPVDGKYYTVQYFERARFEHHPEHQGTPYEVQLGHLGYELLAYHPRALEVNQPAEPIKLLGEAKTSYAASIEERIHNIGQATAMFNGMMIPRGTEFSFNASGEFDEEHGFVDGYAIIGDRLERVVAGGLCQVSTTMFRAVSNAGLQITERHGHTFIVNFYENILGFDATVYDPYVDFKWYNDTPGPVYISTASNVNDATVTFWIWGYDDGRTVSYEGPYTENWQQPGPAIWEYDPDLPYGAVRQLVHGRSGVDVTYIRTVTMPNGTVLHRDTFFTQYEPWADFYIYGPGAR